MGEPLKLCFCRQAKLRVRRRPDR